MHYCLSAIISTVGGRDVPTVPIVCDEVVPRTGDFHHGKLLSFELPPRRPTRRARMLRIQDPLGNLFDVEVKMKSTVTAMVAMTIECWWMTIPLPFRQDCNGEKPFSTMEGAEAVTDCERTYLRHSIPK